MSSGIELIKKAIKEKASAEVQQILSKAEEDARRIVKDAEEEVKKSVERTAKPEVMIAKRKILGSAVIEGKRAVLAAKAEEVSRVFEVARNRLSEETSKTSEYQSTLFKLLKEAIVRLGEKKVVVSASRRDLGYLKKDARTFSEKLGRELGYNVEIVLANETYDCMGGVVVASPDKSKIFYNTLDGRLATIRDKMELEVSRVLFGE